MVERLRALFEHPPDRGPSRAVLVVALVACTGFAIVSLFDGGGDRLAGVVQVQRDWRPPRAVTEGARATTATSSAEVADQNRQDRPGTVVHRRLLEEVAGHRALQHVPYRAAGVSIELAGARRGRALLTVKASTRGAARRGWRRFLRRFDDAGSAYVPRFEGGRHRG